MGEILQIPKTNRKPQTIFAIERKPQNKQEEKFEKMKFTMMKLAVMSILAGVLNATGEVTFVDGGSWGPRMMRKRQRRKHNAPIRAAIPGTTPNPNTMSSSPQGHMPKYNHEVDFVRWYTGMALPKDRAPISNPICIGNWGKNRSSGRTRIVATAIPQTAPIKIETLGKLKL